MDVFFEEMIFKVDFFFNEIVCDLCFLIIEGDGYVILKDFEDVRKLYIYLREIFVVLF